MVTLAVNPNRMELLKLKRRMGFAVRGHKLLKDKQESLMQEFMRVLKLLKGMYDEVEQALFTVYEKYYRAQASADPYALEAALESPKDILQIAVTLKKRMGYTAPEFTLPEIPSRRINSAASTPLALKAMDTSMREVFPKMIMLAQIEKQIEMLAKDIEKTRRRVNALEYNMIPVLKETIRSITMKLEERDRAERTVLMKVKELLK